MSYQVSALIKKSAERAKIKTELLTECKAQLKDEEDEILQEEGTYEDDGSDFDDDFLDKLPSQWPMPIPDRSERDYPEDDGYYPDIDDECPRCGRFCHNFCMDDDDRC